MSNSPKNPPRDPSDVLAPDGWRLRVVDGPTRGTTCTLGDRIAIGRAASSDLQLLDQEVSRQHALVVEDRLGRHVLTDLESRNGTHVEGKSVHRHVLRPHTVITIAGTALIYEPVPTGAEPSPNPPRLTDVRTFRSTAEHAAVAEVAEAAVVTARAHAPTTPVGTAVSPDALLDRDGRALVFEHPDGHDYEGNLIADLLEYRTLRAQHLRGGFGDQAMTRRFEQLKAALQQPPSSGPRRTRRACCRFGCWLPARIRLASGESLPCHIRDVGVDGAQLVAPNHHLLSEQSVCLMVDVIESGQRRSIVLAGRVVWTDAEFLGLTFAGALRQADGRYAESPARREQLPSEVTVEIRSPRLRLAVDPGQA